jgi:hypothetical protein
MLFYAISSIMVISGILCLRDQSRSTLGRQVLGLGRIILALFAVALALLWKPQPGQFYSYMVVLSAILIAAGYFPLIAANAIDGRVERFDKTSRRPD